MINKTKRFRIVVIYRDARTGRITTEAYALRHPSTTIREVRRVPP